jgi:hypothetical protein
MSLRLTQGDENHSDSPMMVLKGLNVVFDCAVNRMSVAWVHPSTMGRNRLQEKSLNEGHGFSRARKNSVLYQGTTLVGP